jgi:molybdenum cofactor guanylyltransferase
MQPDQNTNYDVTVVLLAGGSSRRMHGRDKGLIPLHGKPLVSHVIEQLAPQAAKLLISCNENCAQYSHFGYPVIADTLSGGLGPLAGLLSGMEHADTQYILSAPCDTPYLPKDLLSRMLKNLQQSEADVCTVTDGQRLHPVFMLVSRQLHTDLKTYLQSGGRKVLDWYNNQHHSIADFSDQPNAFANINTPEQLQAEETN